MKTFPPKVEQWRGLAKEALEDVLANNDSKKAAIYRVGLTNEDTLDIILALVQKESSGDSNAVGDSGNSIGLMQLNYGAGTPQGAGYDGPKEDLKNPYINLYYGIKVFLTDLEKYQDIEKAILAYNAGRVRTGPLGLPINLPYLEAVVSFLSEKKTLFLSSLWDSSLFTWLKNRASNRTAPPAAGRPPTSNVDAHHKPATPLQLPVVPRITFVTRVKNWLINFLRNFKLT